MFEASTSKLVNSVEGNVVRRDPETGVEEPIAIEIAKPVDAAVSPDGGRIAFSFPTAIGRDDNDLWVGRVDGSAL